MNKLLMLLGLFVIALPTLAEFPTAEGQDIENHFDSIEAIVETKLLTPLHKKEQDRSRFSRAALPATARRVRILDKSPQSDTQGRAFFRFAVDESRSLKIKQKDTKADFDWQQNTITGCVYPKTREVLVRLDKNYYDASVMWGIKTAEKTTDVCREIR